MDEWYTQIRYLISVLRLLNQYVTLRCSAQSLETFNLQIHLTVVKQIHTLRMDFGPQFVWTKCGGSRGCNN